jgi:hypothetical protein
MWGKRVMMRKVLTWLAALATCVFACAPAYATANLLINSDFSDYTLKNDPTNNGSFSFGDLTPQGKANNVLTGWNTTGYNFIETPGSATTTGSLGIYGSLLLYGPGNGVSNGFVDAPSGHNFIAADAGLHLSDGTGTAAITQIINNLTIGSQYRVTFDGGSAQQVSFSGATTEQWIVSFGNTGLAGTDETYSTPFDSNVSFGFTGWHTTSFLFTATGTTQTLAFLANGTPEGQPPFSLLADPTLQAVPEPATWAMMLIGFGTMGVMMRGRRNTLPGRRNSRLQAI